MVWPHKNIKKMEKRVWKTFFKKLNCCKLRRVDGERQQFPMWIKTKTG
jgi:hypothetical protein